MGKHRVAARTSKPFAHVLSPLCVAIYYACVLLGAAAVRNPDTVARTPNAAAHPFQCNGQGYDSTNVDDRSRRFLGPKNALRRTRKMVATPKNTHHRGADFRDCQPIGVRALKSVEEKIPKALVYFIQVELQGKTEEYALRGQHQKRMLIVLKSQQKRLTLEGKWSALTLQAAKGLKI
ncbi:hypothetical protein E2542_SST24842 [Spatholobus suberectus]|nr:hypothetical protein E2542_SST24842 [Spatholobus suberectus]